MLIATYHKINLPGQFWPTLQKAMSLLPINDPVQLLQILPSKDIHRAMSVWDASSIDTLDKWLRSEVSNSSEEIYFEVDAGNAVGLPG